MTHDEQMAFNDFLFIFGVACCIGCIMLMIMVLFGQAKLMGMM